MKAAVICSQGIGDGLLMMVASHRLFSRGYQVTTYQDNLCELSHWFPDHQFKKRLSLKDLQKELSIYDLIILQNDNSSLSFEIIQLYKQGKLHNLSVFYSSYSPEKHPVLTSWDRVFDRSRPMVDNIAQAIASVLQCSQISKNNGLVIPRQFVRNCYYRRILIHPTSASSQKNWFPKQFLELAQALKKKDYEVVFCVSPKERQQWIGHTNYKYLVPEFPTLSDLAEYVFESAFLIGNDSGTGHLASNLHIPTLTIASCPKHMSLWRPAWFTGQVITPYRFIPNIKPWRTREKYWQHFITPRRVFKAFQSQMRRLS